MRYHVINKNVDLVDAKLCGPLLGAAALIELGNEAIGAGHRLGGACGDIIAEKTLQRRGSAYRYDKYNKYLHPLS